MSPQLWQKAGENKEEIIMIEEMKKEEKIESPFVWDGFEFSPRGEGEYWVKPVNPKRGERLVFPDELKTPSGIRFLGDSVVKSVEDGIITVVSTRTIPTQKSTGEVVYREVGKTTFHVEGCSVEVGTMEYGNLDPYLISVIVSPEGAVHDACCITGEDLEWESPDFGTLRDSYYCGAIGKLLSGELYARWWSSK